MTRANYFLKNLVEYGASEYTKARSAGEALHLTKISMELLGFEKTKELLTKLKKKSIAINPGVAKTALKYGVGLAGLGTAAKLGAHAYGVSRAKKDATLRGQQLRNMLIGMGVLGAGAGLSYLAANKLANTSGKSLTGSITDIAQKAQIMHLQNMYSNTPGGTSGFAAPTDYRRIGPAEQARLLRIYEQNYL